MPLPQLKLYLENTTCEAFTRWFYANTEYLPEPFHSSGRWGRRGGPTRTGLDGVKRPDDPHWFQLGEKDNRIRLETTQVGPRMQASMWYDGDDARRLLLWLLHEMKGAWPEVAKAIPQLWRPFTGSAMTPRQWKLSSPSQRTKTLEAIAAQGMSPDDFLQTTERIAENLGPGLQPVGGPPPPPFRPFGWLLDNPPSRALEELAPGIAAALRQGNSSTLPRGVGTPKEPTGKPAGGLPKRKGYGPTETTFILIEDIRKVRADHPEWGYQTIADNLGKSKAQIIYAWGRTGEKWEPARK